jgi:putative oxidoreductase
MAENVTPRIEDVRGSGIYPATGPFPKGPAVVRSPAALAHPEERQPIRASRPALETAALLAGRAIFGGYFLYNGINHFLNREMLTDYARSKGVPAPDLAVAASGLLILAGGLSVVTGAQPKVGAALIATFLLGVSPQMHAFWKEQDPQQRMHEMVNFTKNMALVGASLLAAGHPEPWPWHLGASSAGALVATRS